MVDIKRVPGRFGASLQTAGAVPRGAVRGLQKCWKKGEFRWQTIHDEIVARFPWTLHIGHNSLCQFVNDNGEIKVKKKVLGDRTLFERELLACELFSGYSWFPPVLDQGPDYIEVPYFENARLDQVAESLDEATRFEVAKQAVTAMFDMFMLGYAHRDFHAKNVFWHKGQLFLSDFETLEKYPDGELPPFCKSYDLVAENLDSPLETRHMCYTKSHRLSLSQVLGIPIEQVLHDLENTFLQQLRDACTSFKTALKSDGRHNSSVERIYGSFQLPHLTVAPDQTQRDSEKRLALFGLTPDFVKGKTVLDLGSNVGAMSFSLHSLGAKSVSGIEYDNDKVKLANRIAAYNGLTTVNLRQGDIDELDTSDFQDGYDIVLCLAIESHIKHPDRLYRLLERYASNVVCFEGNSLTDRHQVESQLQKHGFATVEYLGFCDDDCVPKHNNRPVFLARKA